MNRRHAIASALLAIFALFVVSIVTTGLVMWVALGCTVLVVTVLVIAAVPTPTPPREPPPSHHYIEMYARAIERPNARRSRSVTPSEKPSRQANDELQQLAEHIAAAKKLAATGPPHRERTQLGQRAPEAAGRARPTTTSPRSATASRHDQAADDVRHDQRRQTEDDRDQERTAE